MSGFGAHCGNGHHDLAADCYYCEHRRSVAADLLILDAMCPKHSGRCDPDCGACGQRQEAAGRWLFQRVESTAKSLRL